MTDTNNKSFINNTEYYNFLVSSIPVETQLKALDYKKEIEKNGTVNVTTEEFISKYYAYELDREKEHKSGDAKFSEASGLIGALGIFANAWFIHAVAAKQMIASGHGGAGVATVTIGAIAMTAAELGGLNVLVKRETERSLYKKHIAPLISQP